MKCSYVEEFPVKTLIFRSNGKLCDTYEYNTIKYSGFSIHSVLYWRSFFFYQYFTVSSIVVVVAFSIIYFIFMAKLILTVEEHPVLCDFSVQIIIYIDLCINI